MKQCVLFLVTSLLATTALVASADETYVCLFGNNERTIRVTYTYPDSQIPCEVVYEKETGSQVLWSAQNEEGYCEAQAAAFVDKQRGWGWDCARMEAPADTPAPEPVLDTEAASPALD